MRLDQAGNEHLELAGEHIPVPVDFKSNSEDIVSFLKRSTNSASLRGVQPSALAYLLSMAVRQIRKPFVLIAPTDREAEKLTEIVGLFMGEGWQANGAQPLERQGVVFAVSQWPQGAGTRKSGNDGQAA